MPFDGGFLHKIKQELEPMIGARVDKIGQPNRDCVVIHLHNRGPVCRLVILAVRPHDCTFRPSPLNTRLPRRCSACCCASTWAAGG